MEGSIRLKAIFKRHSIKGYQKWVVDAVAFGSAGTAVEGRHYCCNIRINKEIFCTLVQFSAKNKPNGYQDLAYKLKGELILLGWKASPENLQNVIDNQNFQILYQSILEE